MRPSFAQRAINLAPPSIAADIRSDPALAGVLSSEKESNSRNFNAPEEMR
jgi:hypothetical protein